MAIYYPTLPLIILATLFTFTDYYLTKIWLNTGCLNYVLFLSWIISNGERSVCQSARIVNLFCFSTLRAGPSRRTALISFHHSTYLDRDDFVPGVLRVYKHHFLKSSLEIRIFYYFHIPIYFITCIYCGQSVIFRGIDVSSSEFLIFYIYSASKPHSTSCMAVKFHFSRVHKS